MNEKELLKQKEFFINEFKKKNGLGLLDYEYYKSEDKTDFIVIQHNNQKPIAYLYDEEFTKGIVDKITNAYPVKNSKIEKKWETNFNNIPLLVTFKIKDSVVKIELIEFIVRLVRNP